MAILSPGLLGGLSPSTPNEDERQRSIINDAVIQGQQAENIRQQEQQAQQMAANEAARRARIAQIATAIPEYDMKALDFARRMVGAKTGYEQAADAAEQARQHEIAEATRAAAAKMGIDLSPYDANVNANQARTNYDMALEDARRNFMNAETPDEFYTRRKNELISSGMNEKKARDQAGREYQEYNAKYLHMGKNLYYDQGTTDNAINNLGVYLLSGMMSGDPQTAQLFASMYAHPVDNYKKNWAAEKAYMAADIANQRDAQRHAWDIEDFDRRLRGEQENAAFKHGLEMDTLQTRSNLDSAAFANRMSQVYNMAVNAGFSPEEALLFTFTAVGGGGRSGGRANTTSKTNTEVMKEVRGRMKDIEDKYSGDLDALRNDPEYQQLTQTYSGLLYGGGSQQGGNGRQYDMNNYNDASAYMLAKIRENSSMSNPYTETEMKELFLSQGIPEEWISHYLGGEQSNASSQPVDPNANSPRLPQTEEQAAKYAELDRLANTIKDEEAETKKKRGEEAREFLSTWHRG